MQRQGKSNDKPPCWKTQSGNWLNQVTGVISEDATTKDKTKISSPLAQSNWGNKWGCYTQRQDKVNAQTPSPLLKKSNKNDTQPYWIGVIDGVITPKHKAAAAKPPCQYNFKIEFVRLPYKTKYKMYCFQVHQV